MLHTFADTCGGAFIFFADTVLVRKMSAVRAHNPYFYLCTSICNNEFFSALLQLKGMQVLWFFMCNYDIGMITQVKQDLQTWTPNHIVDQPGKKPW